MEKIEEGKAVLEFFKLTQHLFVAWFIQWQSHHSLKSPLSNSLLWPESTELSVQILRQSGKLEGFLVLLSLVTSTSYAAFLPLAFDWWIWQHPSKRFIVQWINDALIDLVLFDVL